MLEQNRELLQWLTRCKSFHQCTKHTIIKQWIDKYHHLYSAEMRYLIFATIDENLLTSPHLVFKSFNDSNAGSNSYKIINKIIESKNNHEIQLTYFLLSTSFEGQYSFSCKEHQWYEHQLAQLIPTKAKSGCRVKCSKLKLSLLLFLLSLLLYSSWCLYLEILLWR